MTQAASRRLGRFVEYTCDALMVAAAIATATLYWTLPMLTDQVPGGMSTMFVRYQIVLTVSGVVAILLLWQARGVMRHVNGGVPFVPDTVRRLQIGAGECLALAAFYLFTAFWIKKLYMVVVMVTFSLVGLLVLVLSEMIRQAIALKEENDMTI